jgi:hypothetical protein
MTDSTCGQAQYQGFEGDDSEEEAEVARSDQWDFSNLLGFETSIAELEVRILLTRTFQLLMEKVENLLDFS